MMNSKYKVRLLVFVSVLPILHFLTVAMVFSVDLPKGDHWGWINLLSDYYEGTLSFVELITHDFSLFAHSHILTIFSSWVNYKLLDLRFDVEAWFGTVWYLASGCLFLFYFFKKYQDSRNKIELSCYLFLFSLVYFCVHSPAIFSWSLISFEFIYWFMVLILAILVDQYLVSSRRLKILLFWCVFLLFCGDAIGITGLFAGLLVALVHIGLLKRARLYLLASIVIIVVSVGLQYAVLPISSHHSGDKAEKLVYIILNPEKSVEFMVNAYAQSVFDMNKSYLFSESSQWLLQKTIGVLMLVFTTYCIVTYYRNKVYERSTLPMFLILFTVVAIVGILMERLQEYGPGYALSPRYTRLYSASLLGCVWILADARLARDQSDKQGLVSPFIPILCTSIALMVFIFSSFLVWKYSASYFRHYQTKAHGIYQAAVDKEYIVGKENSRCQNHYCDRGIQFLREHQLSLFRKGISNKLIF